MPHFRLEYSTNVSEEPDAKDFFARVHKQLSELGPFSIDSMKSRIIPCSKFFVCDGKKDQAFVHLELSILPGRDSDLKKRISTNMLATLKDTFSLTAEQKVCSFSVEIRELDGDSYSKELTGQ